MTEALNTTGSRWKSRQVVHLIREEPGYTYQGKFSLYGTSMCGVENLPYRPGESWPATYHRCRRCFKEDR